MHDQHFLTDEPKTAAEESQRLASLQIQSLLNSPVQERFERLTRITQQAFQVPIAGITLIDQDYVWFKSIQGVCVGQIPRVGSFCGQTIQGQGTMVVPDVRVDPRFMDNPMVLDVPGLIFYAGCPLSTVDGTNIGTLCVADHRPREWTKAHTCLLTDLAALVESEFLALAHAGVQEELLTQLGTANREAEVDPLTRLWNHESIFTLLDRDIARARRWGHGVGVIMADLDHFKAVNDTHGHAVGDEVLRETAKRLLGAIGEDDALGRCGGEEFLLVLARCESLERALILAQELRTAIGGQPILTRANNLTPANQAITPTDLGLTPTNQGITQTISLGVAYADSTEGLTGPLLARLADAALYEAKKMGRNRVEAAVYPDRVAA